MYLRSLKTSPTCFHARIHPRNTCMHMCTPTPFVLTVQVYPHANGSFWDNLITRRRFARSLRISPGRNGNFILQGANISPGLWKIPFKWSQAEKRLRICLAFCPTVYSAYTALCSSFFFFFSDGTAHRRVLGTEMWRHGGPKGLIWW